MSQVEYLTDDNFEEKVLKSEQPAIVVFSSPACGPCRDMAPVLDDIANDRPDLGVFKINVLEHKETKLKLGVRVLPTVFLFRNQNVIDVQFGDPGKENFLKWIEKSLEKPTETDMNLDEAAAYATEKLGILMQEMKKAREATAAATAQDCKDGTCDLSTKPSNTPN